MDVRRASLRKFTIIPPKNKAERLEQSVVAQKSTTLSQNNNLWQLLRSTTSKQSSKLY